MLNYGYSYNVFVGAEMGDKPVYSYDVFNGLVHDARVDIRASASVTWYLELFEFAKMNVTHQFDLINLGIGF